MSDFFNLRQMWPTDESAETSFDLVAVHGLADGSLSTWTNDAGGNWLHWVHQKMPAIRVLVFGYPAVQAYLSSNGADDQLSREGNYRLFTFAEALCGGLRAKRMQKKGPITFIGHGVGGILIKTALSYCSNRQELFGEILNNTIHIIFLDTPHQGLDDDQWNAIHQLPANTQGRLQFSSTSKPLQDLVVTFGDVVSRQHIKVTTAWADTIESIKDGQGLKPLSVRLGIPLEEAIYLHNVSHKTICRFRDKSDDNYQVLSTVIRTELLAIQQQSVESPRSELERGIWKLAKKTNSDLQRLSKLTADNSTKLHEIQDAVQQQYASRAEPDKITLDSQHRKSELLTWLWPQPFGINWENDLDDAFHAVQNTCQWILHREEYTSWQDSEESRLMYIHGMAGCGKSTLAAFLIGRFRKSRQHTSFFFCHETMHSPVVRLTALAYQVLNGLPDDEVIRILAPHRDMTTNPSVSTLTTAKDVLLDALLIATGQQPCYIVLDALDECSDKPAHRDKVEFLKALVELVLNIPFGLKILCTSRNESQIQSLMARHQNIVVDLEIKPEYIEADISTMIAAEIDEQPELKNKLVCGSLWEFAVDGLRSSAGGMFLLPKMMIKDLTTKSTIQEIRTFFNDLPSDLPSYYMSILTRIGSRNLGIWKSYDSIGSRVITWLCSAFVDLTVKELEEVVTSSEESSFASLESDIRSSFGCLVTIDQGHIRLSHPSVRRFLLTSPEFRASDLHERLVRPDPHAYLGSICLQYLKKANTPLEREGERFPDRDAESLRLAARYPFLRYAAVYWTAHCRASRNPLKFVPSIHELICSDKHHNLLQWYAASLLGRGQYHEDFTMLCRFLHNFVLELRRLAPRNRSRDDFTFDQIDQISVTLRKIWRFVMMWHGVIAAFPYELRTLGALIDSPCMTKKEGQQGVLIVHDPTRRIAQFKHFMLEKRHLFNDTCDRFLLTDLSIIMWRSLMPCSPLERKGAHLDPAYPLNIEMYSESIFPGLFPPEGREGRDKARIGSLLAACVVSKDLRFVAIAWPRFEPDQPTPSKIVVKSYMWSMAEIDGGLFMEHIPWTEEEESEDPCRVDRTWSHSFKGSRNAVAFTRDSQYLWTAGGRYRILDGQFRSPPMFFYDRDMTQISFSKHATAIAGIRQGYELWVYDLTDQQAVFRTSTEGIRHLIDLSPDGQFILALSGDGVSESGHADEGGIEEVCLITNSGCRVVLWSRVKVAETLQSEDERATESVASLITFYNNGGLHAFSENESVLVICIPTSPDWSLLAFDLDAPNIVESKWTVEYTDYLAGAAIMSLAFSPIQERQLHVLDTLSNMRTIEISRRSVDGQSISTLLGNDQPILISALVKNQQSRGHYLYSATIPPQHLEHQQTQVTLWDLTTFERKSPKGLQTHFLRYFVYLKSDSLVVEFDPILQAGLDYGLWTGDFDWGTMTASAQLAIEDTKKTIEDSITEAKLQPDESAMDCSSQVKTKVFFDKSASMCFFYSAIYTPISVPSTTQRLWSLSVMMDVRHVATATKIRKTTPYVIYIGTVYMESFKSTYHDETKTLAYCVSVVYSDRDDHDGSFTVANRLFILHLSEPEAWSTESKAGPSFIESLSYEMDGLHISDLVFSPCGRFIYWVAYWSDVEVYKYDTWQQATVLKLTMPLTASLADYKAACFSLSFYRDRLYLSLVLSSIVNVIRLPSCAWPEHTKKSKGDKGAENQGLPADSSTPNDDDLGEKKASDDEPEEERRPDRLLSNSSDSMSSLPGASIETSRVTTPGKVVREGDHDDDDAYYLARVYFLGPHFLRSATDLTIIWPEDQEGHEGHGGGESESETIAVIRCPNYLRKDGNNGASPDQAQSPVVLSTRASTLPEWQKISTEGLVEVLPKTEKEKKQEEGQNSDNNNDGDAKKTRADDKGEVEGVVQDEEKTRSHLQVRIPGAWEEEEEEEDHGRIEEPSSSIIPTGSGGPGHYPEGPSQEDLMKSNTDGGGGGPPTFVGLAVIVFYLSLVGVLLYIFP